MSKLKVSKTTYWKLESGEVYNLDDLPVQVVQQIEIYDSIREDLTDIKYQEQVFGLALATKRQQLEAIISSMAKAAQQNATKETPPDTVDD